MGQAGIGWTPLLTLWASIVARRLGYAEDEALTLGSAISGLAAQTRGRRLGLYPPCSAGGLTYSAGPRESQALGWTWFMGWRVPSLFTEQGFRALSGDEAIDPDGVKRYLAEKFAGRLVDVSEKLTQLAAAYPPEELAFSAMSVYMALRPRGARGWAGRGGQEVLDLQGIDRLIEERRRLPPPEHTVPGSAAAQ